MMRRSILAMTLLALPPLALTLSGCGGGDTADKGGKAPAGPRLVLAMADAPDWQDVSAEVATVDQAQVMARTPGILSTLSVRAGDVVRKGQVIGRVTDSGAGGSGAQAATAAAQAELARADLDRVRYLYQNGVYAKARLEQVEAAAKIASAQATAARAAEDVVAPTAGRVLRADIPAGAPVAPGMVVAVITAGPVVLRLEVPESLAGRVRVGSHVLASGLGTGNGDASGNAVTGVVAKLYPAVQAGQVTADAALPGLDASFIGRRAAAKVEAGHRQALLVPKSFVTTRYGIDYVTMLGKDGAASVVPVQTAPGVAQGKVEILSGARAGDTLIGDQARGSGQ
jgi:RND family efflux transporter MFP subunit